MKYILLFIFPLLFIGACDTQDDNGYPKKVEFGSRGGTVTVTGEDWFIGLSIYDGYEEHPSYTVGEYDRIASYGWLTVKTDCWNNSLTIIAETNTTGRKRKLEIFGEFGTEYTVIKVEQDA